MIGRYPHIVRVAIVLTLMVTAWFVNNWLLGVIIIVCGVAVSSLPLTDGTCEDEDFGVAPNEVRFPFSE